MIIYIFKCYSLNLFHPLLPPLCPQVWTHELLHSLIIEDIKEKTLIITLASKQDCILQIKQAINNYKKKTRKLQLVTQEICSDFYTYSSVCVLCFFTEDVSEYGLLKKCLKLLFVAYFEMIYKSCKIREFTLIQCCV